MNKFNFANLTTWSHHRTGWRYAIKTLENLHNPLGILFFDWADAIFRDNVQLNEPWVGMLHNALSYPNEYTHKYGKGIYCLSDLTNCPVWEQNIKLCKGLFTFSQYTADFLKTITDKPVTPLIHPSEENSLKFEIKNFNYKIVTLGQWLRRYHSIYELETSWEKVVVKSGDWWSEDYKEMQRRGKGKVLVQSYVEDEEYDNILSTSVVFLDLYDCSACNVVLECIMRNTPILINRHPAVEEYLGKDYPMFFDNLAHASSLLHNESIVQANEFLRQKDKSVFSNVFFKNSIVNSDFYQQLKTRNQILYA